MSCKDELYRQHGNFLKHANLGIRSRFHDIRQGKLSIAIIIEQIKQTTAGLFICIKRDNKNEFRFWYTNSGDLVLPTEIECRVSCIMDFGDELLPSKIAVQELAVRGRLATLHLLKSKIVGY